LVGEWVDGLIGGWVGEWIGEGVSGFVNMGGGRAICFVFVFCPLDVLPLYPTRWHIAAYHYA